MTSSGKKGVAPSKTDLFCLFEYEARSFGIFLFAAITSKMKIIWNKIEHKKNIATPFLYKQYSSCTFTKRYPCIFSSFPPVGLERKHSRALGLSLCQSVRLIKYGITEWFLDDSAHTPEVSAGLNFSNLLAEAIREKLKEL